MNPPPAASSPDATGPPDRQTLRLLERQLTKESVVADTDFEPHTHEPRCLCALLDTAYYPELVETARLDIRWFMSDDFSIHYVETTANNRWECRWDRHPNDHNAREHFHQPPDGSEVTDVSFPTLHPLDVYSTVCAALEQRRETLWGTDQ